VPSSNEETLYRLMKAIEANPEASQRDLARLMGVSLGKVNYCLKGLIEKGLVKARNFRKSNNKRAYAYYLTPRGIREKAAITARYLAMRMEEYERIRREIEQLSTELRENHSEVPLGLESMHTLYKKVDEN